MMKKFGIAWVMMAISAACFGDDTSSISMNKDTIKSYVHNRCTTELQSRTEWRLIAIAMSSEKQAAWENKICGCASEDVMNYLVAEDWAQFLSESSRVKMVKSVAEVTTKTVTSCFKRLYQK